MFLGIFSGVLAGALWGMVFLIPKWLPGFSPLELSLGRYLAYGAVAFLGSLFILRNLFRKLNKKTCWALARQVLMGNILYFYFLSYGVRYAGVAPTSLIVGMLPLAIPILSSLFQKQAFPKELRAPLLLVIGGLIFINIDLFSHLPTQNNGQMQGIIGIACASIALFSWTRYAIENAQFLKQASQFSAYEWSTLFGLGSGVLSLFIVLPWFMINMGGDLTGHSEVLVSRSWLKFWAINGLVAVLASYLGTMLWNVASRRLPITLTGQLILFETLFAMFYGFILESRMPRTLEIAAVVLLLGGVLWSVRRHAMTPKETQIGGAH